MAFKYQVFLCPRPKDLLLISYNHIDTIREFVKDTPVVLNQVDETHRKIIEVYCFLFKCLILRVLRHIASGYSSLQFVHFVLTLWIPAVCFYDLHADCTSCVTCFCSACCCRFTHLYQRVNSSFSDKHCSYFFKTCTFGWVLCFYSSLRRCEIKIKQFIDRFIYSFLLGVTFPQKSSPESQRTFCPVNIGPSASWDRCSRPD